VGLSADDTILLKKYFVNRPIRRAYLFGSYARNTAIKSSSDIDIMVELDHTEPIGMKFFRYRLELEELLKKRVDLVSADGLSKHVQPFIDRDKVLIYERTAD
jgi:predicted nucleotidyltransferase